MRYTHDNLAPQATQNAHIALHGEEGTITIEAYPADPFSSVRIASGDGEAEIVPVPDDLRQAYEDERRVNIEEQFLGWVMGGAEPTPLLLTLQQGLQSIDGAEAFCRLNATGRRLGGAAIKPVFRA